MTDPITTYEGAIDSIEGDTIFARLWDISQELGDEGPTDMAELNMSHFSHLDLDPLPLGLIFTMKVFDRTENPVEITSMEKSSDRNDQTFDSLFCISLSNISLNLPENLQDHSDACKTKKAHFKNSREPRLSDELEGGIRSTINDLPAITFTRLWHLGTMDSNDKRPGSMEGACLSVSNCPESWRIVSDGMVDGDLWLADGSKQPFLDALSLNDATKSAILEWGREEGLCKQVELWEVQTYDEEAGENRTIYTETKLDAECELDLDEEDPQYEQRFNESARLVLEHVPTDLLNQITFTGVKLYGDSQTIDMLLPLWTWAKTDLCGVWWNETHDPYAYSAPRGGILPARLNRLEFERHTENAS